MAIFDPRAIAIEICNKDAFKTEVLSDMSRAQETPEECKRRWDKKVEIIATSLLEDYPTLETLQREAVIGAVFSIALRMLIWIEFYVGTFNFSRDFCIEFLEIPLFTSKGIIDPQRVETNMLRQELSNLQRFQLASFYCQWMEIPISFNNLSAEDKNLVFNENDPELVNQPNIIKFWSYYAKGELDIFKGTIKTEHFRIIVAVTSGSQLAVNYCLDRTKSKQSSLLDIAVSIFRHRVHVELLSDEDDTTIAGDWIVFRNKRYNCSKESWIPDTFYADIFYSILSEMSESQKVKFWKQIVDIRFTRSDNRITGLLYAEVLEFLLCWPYQEIFFELLKLSWENVSCSVFSYLLLKIVDRIEPRKGQFCYGEERFCDYRKMLMESWTECPLLTKNKLFRKQEENTTMLLKKLYNLKGFSERDRTNIKFILESVPENIRCHFLSTDGGHSISTMLLKNRRLHLFDELISICHSTPEEYKLTIVFNEAMKRDCLWFVENEMWGVAEEILRWSDCELTEEDMLILKAKLIRSDEGVKTCIDLWKANSNAANNFIRWSRLPPKEQYELKTNFLQSKAGVEVCRELCLINRGLADSFLRWCIPQRLHLKYKIYLFHCPETISACIKYVVIDNTPELADRLIRWCIPRKKIKQCKLHLGHNKLEVFPKFKTTFEGIENCALDELPDKIFDWGPEQNDDSATKNNFPDETEPKLFFCRIFSWWFDSDPEEIKKFKEMCLRKLKREILYEFIELNNWNLADKYLSCLNLDKIDIRKTKTEQICSDPETSLLFSNLLSKKEDDPKFTDTGGKQQTIERFIYWFLVDGLSDVEAFIIRMLRYSDDNIVQSIIKKLKSSNDIEAIKKLLFTT